MDILENPADALLLVSAVVLAFVCALQSMELSRTVMEEDDSSIDDAYAYEDFVLYDQFCRASWMDKDRVSYPAATFLDDDLLLWVAPRYMSWISRFLLREYDDEKWVQMFRMTKRAVMSLASVLQPSIPIRDNNDRHDIPVIVQLACTLFKLSQGASLLVCSEKFAVGRSTVSKMLRNVVRAINVALRSEMSWPSGDRLLSTAADFYQLCGLPGVVGAIDGTQIPICKPNFGAMDYYNYFKIKGYSMTCQAVVDSSKRFMALNVGMPGSTHDARTLRRSSLYIKAQRNVLWDAQTSFQGFKPYLLGDSQYPLLPWLMVPHRQRGELSTADALFNEKMSQGRRVVDNAFTLLKQSFRELQGNSELNVAFLPDVVVCCALLHNVLLQQSPEDVERRIEALRTGRRPPAQEADGNALNAGHEAVRISAEQMCRAVGVRKRRALGLYLAAQRNIVPL